MIGSWRLDNYTPINLPGDIKEVWDKTIGEIVGVGYTPVFYVGSQVVTGINYMIIATAKAMVPNANVRLVKITINKNKDVCSVVSIDSIV